MRWFLFLAVAIVLVALGFREVATARCFAVRGPLDCRAEVDEKVVALTFDDGPSYIGTKTVLPLLDEYGASATFFVEGAVVKARPELVRWIYRSGHELGNHSYSHHRMVGGHEALYAREIEDTDNALKRIGVPKPRWFRPPYGAKFWGLGKLVARNGQTMIMWDVEEPRKATTAQEYADELPAQVKPGSIILMHPMAKSRELEREALPLVLSGLREKGYEITTVGDLFSR